MNNRISEQQTQEILRFSVEEGSGTGFRILLPFIDLLETRTKEGKIKWEQVFDFIPQSSEWYDPKFFRFEVRDGYRYDERFYISEFIKDGRYVEAVRAFCLWIGNDKPCYYLVETVVHDGGKDSPGKSELELYERCRYTHVPLCHSDLTDGENVFSPFLRRLHRAVKEQMLPPVVLEKSDENIKDLMNSL